MRLYEVFESYCDHLCSLPSLALFKRRSRTITSAKAALKKKRLNRQATRAIICVDPWHQWHLSIPTFSMFGSVIPPILSPFSSLSTFSGAHGLFWPGWPHRMAVIVISRTKYAALWIPSPYITKGMFKQECLHSERKVLSPDFKESEDAESFKRNCQAFMGHLLNMGMNNLFLSLIREQKKTKQ